MALVGALAPEIAAACAACVSSAYGDRTYNWAYGGLLIAPFLLALVVGAVLAWNAGYRLRWQRSTPTSLIARIPAHEEKS
jgi:hypothetical protein